MTQPWSPITQLAPINRQIAEQLRTKATAAEIDFARGLSEGEESLDRTPNGAIEPMVVIYFGRPINLPFEEDITGHRQQLKMHSFSVVCIGADDDQLSIVCDVVNDALVGFAPDNCGEIEEAGGRPELPVKVRMTPFRYATTMGFALTIGTLQVP